MGHWMVRGRDEELGVYEGATADEAIAAMHMDAGVDGPGLDPDVTATELCTGCIESGCDADVCGAVEWWIKGVAYCGMHADAARAEINSANVDHRDGAAQ